MYAEAQRRPPDLYHAAGRAVLVGTTDEPFDGPAGAGHAPPSASFDYLLDSVNAILPDAAAGSVGHRFSLQRRASVAVRHCGDDRRDHAATRLGRARITPACRCISVVGGKLTTMRSLGREHGGRGARAAGRRPTGAIRAIAAIPWRRGLSARCRGSASALATKSPGGPDIASDSVARGVATVRTRDRRITWPIPPITSCLPDTELPVPMRGLVDRATSGPARWPIWLNVG